MTMAPLEILVIDDDEIQLRFLEILIASINDGEHRVHSALSFDSARGMIQQRNIGMVLTDFFMPDVNGMAVLEEVRKINPEIDVVVMTASPDIGTAVEIMKNGAYDFLSKPVEKTILEKLILRIQEKQTLRSENLQLREQLQENTKIDTIISESPEMAEVLNMTSRSAESDVNILVQGESGTGKELIAQAIHHASDRKAKPFITVNISALSESLIESALFGHKKGAFTGAVSDHPGRFEQANGGTLFIDEVGDIPLSVQVKLLRTIQFGQVEPIGGLESVTVDVRVITATSRDLEQMIEAGEFRQDFYYRINVITITIPPLRERKSDIPPLVNHIISEFSKEHHKQVTGISSEALDGLMKHDFRGNVRELENILQRAIVLCRADLLTSDDFAILRKNDDEDALLDPKTVNGDYEKKLQAFELAIIKTALTSCNGNKSATARMLGIGERRLRYRLQILEDTSDTPESQKA
jgi:DNA-binding NtrC family response regulator